MSNKKKQWHSLGDFLQAKEERERVQIESKSAESATVNESTGVGTPVQTPVPTPVPTGVLSEGSTQPLSALSESSLPESRVESENKEKTAICEVSRPHEAIIPSGGRRHLRPFGGTLPQSGCH